MLFPHLSQEKKNMRAVALKVAVVLAPLLVAPARADGMPDYNGPGYIPESAPYERGQPRQVNPPVIVPPLTVFERPIVVVRQVVVRRLVIVERPVVIESHP